MLKINETVVIVKYKSSYFEKNLNNTNISSWFSVPVPTDSGTKNRPTF